jgi:endoglucanase
MKQFSMLSISFISIVFLACFSNNNKDSEPAGEILSNSSSSSPSDNNSVQFWDGKNAMLRGMAVGNNVWSANEANLAINDSADYIKLKSLGFNSVRFYLSYKFFENDAAPYSYKQNGWNFLNRNLEWARANGIKLVLNMHVPQGGFQSNGEGAALWDVEENQKRLIA